MLGAALASCTPQSDKQLEAVESVRSVLGEWALAEEQGKQARVPSTYLEQLREDARGELKSEQPQLPATVKALVQPLLDGQPDAAALRQAQASLAPIENQLESA